jgi:hypothetical protein
MLVYTAVTCSAAADADGNASKAAKSSRFANIFNAGDNS